MSVSLPFQQQFTWRKLGYLFFEDSLSYREVLEQNPQWDVTRLPPIGAQLRIAGNGGRAGSLTQGNFIVGSTIGEESFAIYPFDTVEQYDAATYRYTLQGVVEREKINGITFDSTQAITGLQNG